MVFKRAQQQLAFNQQQIATLDIKMMEVD